LADDGKNGPDGRLIKPATKSGTALRRDSRAPRPPIQRKNFSMLPDRQTIVIVEDDLNVGVALTRALATFGYHTELFSSPAECLNAIVTRVAACFVIDIHLGEHSGIELSQQLSALGIKSPVIHMCGSGTDAIRQEALAVGCAAYLEKPFAIPALVRVIERVTGRFVT
jgi:FixJ family two-component response regulator